MTNDLLPLTKQRNDLFRYSRMDVSIITVKIEMLIEKNHCIASQKAATLSRFKCDDFHFTTDGKNYSKNGRYYGSLDSLLYDSFYSVSKPRIMN